MPVGQSEKVYIIDGIVGNMRNDGRKRLDYRNITIETDLISGTSGSAKVLFSFPNTAVLVTIKADIVPVDILYPNEGKVDCSVQFSNSIDPSLYDESLSAFYSQKLMKYLKSSGGMRLDCLCVIPKKFCWFLHIDCLILEYGGNAFDAIILGVYSALNKTK